MADRNSDTYTTWSRESDQDSRNTRWALVVALALHALFFRLDLPETVAAEVPDDRPRVILMPTPMFEPPPPREQQKLPEQRVRKVPWPDPTPDDPEPIPEDAEIVATIDLRDTDLLLSLPDAPPPYRPAGLMRVGGDVLPPVKVFAPPPRYPEIARRARIQGLVYLEAVIDATGTVSRIKVIKGLPMGLDKAAVDAVTNWRFEPATYNDKPVPVIYSLSIYFKLS